MRRTPPPPTFALDFETTGLIAALDQVVELGLAGPRPFHALVSDAPPSTPGAQGCHGISREELQQGGIPGSEALRGLLDALGEGPVRIACHNAAFERGFLEAWAARLGQRLPEIEWVCTLDLARGLCTDPSSPRKLSQLAWRLGLEHAPRHRAMADAALTLRLLEALEGWGRVRAALGDQEFLVYLAGPLRGDGSPEGIRHNQERMLRMAGWAQSVLPRATLVVPHANFAYLDESRDPGGAVRRTALRGCERLLARCEALVLCGRELSAGMEMEKRLAERLGLPILQVEGWDGPDAGVQSSSEGVA